VRPRLSTPLLAIVLTLALAGAAVANTAVGTERADTLVGSNGPDQLYGEGGGDTLRALNGADYVEAGPGPDRGEAGGGPDLVIGGTGADLLLGEDGDDTVYAGHGNDELMASAQSYVSAGDDDDKIYLHDEGGRVDPVGDVRYSARAGSGNDTVDARDGRPSTVDCGPGADRLYADPGDRAAGCERRTESRRR
jgi:Ca2+-binding RTX toxin-like protein